MRSLMGIAGSQRLGFSGLGSLSGVCKATWTSMLVGFDQRCGWKLSTLLFMYCFAEHVSHSEKTPNIRIHMLSHRSLQGVYTTAHIGLERCKASRV